MASGLVHTEELTILVAKLATSPQDGMDVEAMEERALKALVIIRTHHPVLLLILLVDGQDEVDDPVADVGRQTHETRAGVLNPGRIVSLREEVLDVCKSHKVSLDRDWLRSRRRHSCRLTSPKLTCFMSSASNIRSSAFMGALGFFLALALAFFGFPTRPLTVACFWGVSACELLLDDLVATMAACR